MSELKNIIENAFENRNQINTNTIGDTLTINFPSLSYSVKLFKRSIFLYYRI